MLPSRNTLYYGDNLPVLREYIPDASVDLIYLDPPFNSNRNYNVLFKDEKGKDSDSQITAFEDSWHWNDTAEHAYYQLVTDGSAHVGQMIGSLRGFLGTNQMMAYLVMMAARLAELHRVLKPTGSLYLHCDPTASHYLKIILDTIFGPQNFRNEIVWKRTSAHNDAKQGLARLGRIHDIILFYGKSDHIIWNTIFTAYDKEYIEHIYRATDEVGRQFQTQPLHAAKAGGDTRYEWKGQFPPPGRYWAFSRENMEKLDQEGRIVYSKNGVPRYKIYLDESSGISLQDIWSDLTPVHNLPNERLGYPTQKPLALLERIIAASSNPGDVVLDPFCGCGTAVAAAEKLGRRWIGIDVTHLAIALQKSRMLEMFPGITFQTIGEPKDIGAARKLALDDRYQFQWWALSLIKARPLGGEGKQGKKGADQGIDGVIPFLDDTTAKPKRALIQVKSGHVRAGDIRDLRGTIEREQAQLGAFLTLEPPSREMLTEAASAGIYRSPGWQRDYPKLQVLTIEDLLKHHAEVKMPPAYAPFKQAQPVGVQVEQHEFPV